MSPLYYVRLRNNSSTSVEAFGQDMNKALEYATKHSCDGVVALVYRIQYMDRLDETSIPIAIYEEGKDTTNA